MNQFLMKKAKLFGRRHNLRVEIAEAFSTTPYTGNGGTQTITNGIDLAGEGGLVWIKDRSASSNHTLMDVVRGANTWLGTNQTNGDITSSFNFTFNSDGFSQNNDFVNTNASGDNYVSWTFRQAPKFFDIVQFTGDGTSGRQIAHNLGVAPGMIVVKRLDSTSNWTVYHRAGTADSGNPPETSAIPMNLSDVGYGTVCWASTNPTDAEFYITDETAASSDRRINISGAAYIAYLFAHDPSDSGIIQCGSYTGNGSSTGPTITLGWEPQWLLVKVSSISDAWLVYDNKRDTNFVKDNILFPNTSNLENTNNSFKISFNPTGFQPLAGYSIINGSGETYIYMAIRAPE